MPKDQELKTPRTLIILVTALAGIGGCVPSVPQPDTTLDGSINAPSFTFPEDADPIMAALPFVEDQLLVQALPGAEQQAVDAVLEDAGARIVDEIPEIDVIVLETPAQKLIETAERLADSGIFETFQKSYQYQPSLVPNDTYYSRQTHLTQIKADAAWDRTTGSQEIVIAVVDTGVDSDHPDLKEKIKGGRNVYDSNDRLDDVMGHGTMVAGVAAAISNNAVGVAGVAWNSPLLAVRVGNAEGLSTSQHIASGIIWAAGNGAKVINVSFAPLWADRIVKSAVQQAWQRGALVVISAGNAGGRTSAAGYEEATFVGAVTETNQIAAFSDKGPFVDLVAPGTAIRSTTFDGAYGMANGTSFSAPIVAGVAALAWSLRPSLRPVTIREVVLSSAKDLGMPGDDDTYGLGAVDAAAAVLKAAQAFDPVDTTPPTVRISTPVTGQSLSGKTSCTVTATDRYGVADVVMSVDGVPYATDTRSPYTFALDTSSFSAGSHDLSFVAADTAGNKAPARTVRVSFSAGSMTATAGTIRFTSPSAGSSVSGDVTVKASVSDPDGLATIEWLVDGQSVFVAPLSGRSSGVSYLWRTGLFTKGAHTITISIMDSRGNQSRGSLTLTRK